MEIKLSETLTEAKPITMSLYFIFGFYLSEAIQSSCHIHEILYTLEFVGRKLIDKRSLHFRLYQSEEIPQFNPLKIEVINSKFSCNFLRGLDKKKCTYVFTYIMI